MTDIITPEGLRKWLESQPDMAIVGMARQPCDCPVANYFKAQGKASVSAGTTCVSFRADGNWGDHQKHVLPVWAGFFINGVDTRCEGPVSKGKALELLNELMR